MHAFREVSTSHTNQIKLAKATSGHLISYLTDELRRIEFEKKQIKAIESAVAAPCRHADRASPSAALDFPLTSPYLHQQILLPYLHHSHTEAAMISLRITTVAALLAAFTAAASPIDRQSE